ncbi:MAG: DUF2920 family protein [Clostridium sp.]
MAQTYQVQIDSLESIYVENKNKYNRKINVYFSIPEIGINEDTGIMLYASGFGGHANSNVCKKMRNKFADKYNLVTVQCDYFGYEFMQNLSNVIIPDLENELDLTKDEVKLVYEKENFSIEKLINLCMHKNKDINLKVDLRKESLENFNDMGIMQAVDNIVAILTVMSILYNNKYVFNTKKIIGFGNSHGAYLTYLMNVICPDLFSLIIDNSSWIVPNYINIPRYLYNPMESIIVSKEFNYLAKKVILDKQIYDLNYLYSKFENKCNIISYHGVDDELITIDNKTNFCENINKCKLVKIDTSKVNGAIFKNTNHGLGADFLELFDYTLNNLDFNFEKSLNFSLKDNVIIKTDFNKYNFDYTEILPKVYIN